VFTVAVSCLSISDCPFSARVAVSGFDVSIFLFAVVAVCLFQLLRWWMRFVCSVIFSVALLMMP
jgi:hypothetical protein